MKFVTLTFFFSDNKKEPITVTVPLYQFRDHAKQIIDRNGIVVFQGIKIDLTLVNKIIMEFSVEPANF